MRKLLLPRHVPLKDTVVSAVMLPSGHEDAELHRLTQEGALAQRRVVCREVRSVSQGASFSHAEMHFTRAR